MKVNITIENQTLSFSDKEYKFANYYLGEAHQNATKAAILAGYSQNSARQQGYENLTKPYIKYYISYRSQELIENIQVSQEKVVQEVARIAFSDLTDALNNDWSLKALEEMKSETRSAIRSIKQGDGSISLQSYDKLKALELLAKMTGLIK